MRKQWRWALSMAALGWGAGCLAEPVRTLETDAFLIAGEDPKSVLYCRELAMRAETLFANTFGEVPREAPQALLRLVPVNEDADIPALCRRLDTDELLNVDLPWNDSTTRESLSQVLASAWWARAERYAGPGEAVPGWLVSGSAALLEISLNPLYRDGLLQMVEERAVPPGLSDVMAVGLEDSGSAPAYVLLESLLNEHPFGQSSTPLSNWMGLCLPEDLGLSTEDGEGWWATLWESSLGSPRGPHLSLNESARKLEAFAHVLYEPGDGSRIQCLNIQSLIEEPKQRLAMEAQLSQVRADLIRVHPLYHNALLSIGRIYEGLLADESATACAAADAFAVDWMEAQETVAEIRALLLED